MISGRSNQLLVVTSEERLPPRGQRVGNLPAGDFDAVYRTYFPYVWQTLRRLGVAPVDLEDLAHDVFVVVHRRLDDYDPERAIRPWLFGIAFRLASESRRRAHRRREIPTPDVDAPTGLPAADALLESDERRRLVVECLQALNIEQRAVLILVDIDGEAPADIAASLKLPLPTVYSRLRAGRIKFADAVRRATLRRGER
jgi:RNA polymerase sigma-70 factor (ECF subfamily)